MSSRFDLSLLAATALVAAVASFGASPALAQQKSSQTAAPAAPAAVGASMAVLDVQRVLRESAAGKSAAQQLSDLRTKYQAEIAKSEEQLRGEQQELGRQRSLLAPEAFDERRRAFEQKLQTTQRLVQERNGALEGTQRQVRETIGKDVIAVVTDMMKESGILVVVDRGQIVASDASIDITAEVLKRLDKKLPSVKVSAPKQPPAPKP